jgi:hypothetical protein
LPIAAASQTPYFFARLEVVSATDLAPPSDSDFLLLPVERTEDFLPSLGAEPSNSLRVNLAGVCFLGDNKPLNFPALKLGVLLLRRLGALLDGGLQLSRSEDDSDVVEGEL